MPRTLSYRIDVDYLRAVAVLMVVFFHFQVPGFTGGFVGVDIFFVISGYLISGLIRQEIERDEFSFLSFYERRARRIVPALYAMMAVIGIVAWFKLPPTDYRDFFRSAASVVGFVSNIFFWHETGYFDGPPAAKALLHTWSLSVEEQFYLAFPAISLAFLKLRKRFFPNSDVVTVVIVTATVVALCMLSEVAVRSRPDSAFYLAPYRAWEFLVGTLLIWLKPVAPVNRIAALALRTAGACMMIYAAVHFTAATLFPGYAAMVPCVGAALFLFANENVAMSATFVLGSRLN